MAPGKCNLCANPENLQQQRALAANAGRRASPTLSMNFPFANHFAKRVAGRAQKHLHTDAATRFEWLASLLLKP